MSRRVRIGLYVLAGAVAVFAVAGTLAALLWCN